MTCVTTFRYPGDEPEFVVGHAAGGGEIAGAALFAAVRGAPRERALAARDTLLGDCEEVLMTPAPEERDGKFRFSCQSTDYLYGRGTTLGTSYVDRRFEVDLRTLATSVVGP